MRIAVQSWFSANAAKLGTMDERPVSARVVRCQSYYANPRVLLSSATIGAVLLVLLVLGRDDCSVNVEVGCLGICLG